MKSLRLPRFTSSLGVGLLITGSLALGLTACDDHRIPFTGQSIRSTNPKPDWAPNIGDQMQAVIEELGRLAPTPIYQLTPAQARMQPSFKDAVNSLLDKNKIPRPTANVNITEQRIPGWNDVPIRIKVYTPRNATAPMPVIVYYHGGGWVIASPEVYEYSALALSEETGAIVVSVDYRLAPENKFPTAHEDAFAAYKWVKNNAASLNGNPNKVAVAGESAGGNMAITTAMLARDRGVGLPVHILSVFPVADNNLMTPSYKTYANAKPLNLPSILYFTSNYFNTMADGDSPLISLVDVANLSGLPPVTIIGAQIDPLQSEGLYLRDKLVSQGVMATHYLYEGATHEFFGMYAIVPQAQQAQIVAATALKNAFK